MSELKRRRRTNRPLTQNPAFQTEEASISGQKSISLSGKVTTESLIEYIKYAIEMETDLTTQEQIIKACQEDILARKPILKLEDLPYEPKYVDPYEGNLPSGFFWFMVPFSGLLFWGTSFWLFDAGLIIWGIAIALLPFLILYIGIACKRDIEEKIADNEYKKSKYQKDIQKVKENNRAIQISYAKISNECAMSSTAIETEAQPYLDATKTLLEKFYSLNIIYPKYRNLPALTSICEYLVTGRCSELIGPHGAYNLYEDEIRKDTVISQLNAVLVNLEQIKKNQYMLYEQVCAIKDNTNVILNELNQIKGYTVRITQLSTLTAYYAKRNERNSRLLLYFGL